MSYTYKVRLRYAVLDASTNPPTIIKDIFPDTWQDARESTLSCESCVVVFATKQSPIDLGSYIVVEETETA